MRSRSCSQRIAASVLLAECFVPALTLAAGREAGTPARPGAAWAAVAWPAAPVPLPQDQSTRVYLTKAEALACVFPRAARVVELRHLLDASETAAIEALLGQPLNEGGFFLFAALPAAGPPADPPVGYAVIVAEIGKVQPITHIVEVTPDGKAGRVAVMVYRESHGADIATERFMEQYAGKSLADPIRVDRDILNVAGSTLSAHAICRGVRKALAVVKVVLLDRDPAVRAALLATGTDVPLPASDGIQPAAARRDGRAARESAGEAAGMASAERAVMGTLCRIEAPEGTGGHDAPALDAALVAALDEVTRWDGVLSDWRADTPLSLLNAAPPGQPVAVDGDLMAWLLDCRRWCEASDAAFDPAVGSLVDAWGLRTQQPARPSPAALADALAGADFRRLAIDEAGRAVTRPAGLRLDPGASGKGWALDRAADVLRTRGVTSALLSFRSTLVALGPAPGEAAWPVPVVHDATGAVVTTILLRDESLSVSGGALAAFDDGGVERGHVIDPATGVPVEAGRLSWVLAPTGAESDALATALLVRGTALAPAARPSGGYLAAADAAPAAWPPGP